MKKILICFSVLALGLTGCDKNEPVVFDNYKILNNSSTEIIIKSYPIHAFVTGGFEETVVPVLGVRPVDGYGSSTPSPVYSQKGDYCTVSNGVKIVTLKYDDKDDLYVESSYTLISEDYYGHKTFVYVITDDFFDDGEPVE